MDCGCEISSKKITMPIYEPRSSLGTTFVKSPGDCIIDAYKDNNLDCTQFFLGDKECYISEVLTDEESAFLIEENKRLYIHCPYKALLSSGNRDAYSQVRSILNTIELSPSSAVIHLGYRNETNLVDKIDRLQTERHIRTQPNQVAHLLLEVSAGRTGELGASRHSIRHIVEQIDNTKNIGLCLDTAHLFASGVSHLQEHESVVKVFERYNDIMKIGLVHLNDSLYEFGSFKDRHAPIGTSHIWGKKEHRKDGLTSVLSICKDMGIDIICETKDFTNDRCVCTKYKEEIV